MGFEFYFELLSGESHFHCGLENLESANKGLESLANNGMRVESAYGEIKENGKVIKMYNITYEIIDRKRKAILKEWKLIKEQL